MQVTYILLSMNDKKNEGITTTLSLAKTKSISLRTTVPMSIVKQFNLEAGDKLSWKLKAEEGKIVIIVRPLKSEENG